jgi:alpha 1,2-mannosyltransferase
MAFLRRGNKGCGHLLCVVFVVLLIYHAVSKSDIVKATGSYSQSKKPPIATTEIARNPMINEHADFWRALYLHILSNDPECATPEHVGPSHKLDIMYDPERNPPRPDSLWLKQEDIDALRNAHAKFLRDLVDKPVELPYAADTRGVVMTAGLRQLPVLTQSLSMLRRTGCNLPVEVFLSTSEDYDHQICETVFPSLNVKCLIFGEIAAAAGTGVKLTQYQYKIMALLFSSFESVLFLDSDAWPTHDITPLFDSVVFGRHGMILWPDFWYPSESPYYFDISGIQEIPPLNARPSTESGEILLSKKSHTVTLLLAAYYNYYGPDYYYPLQSQGAPGQGDKETFGWAAVATNNSFYTVHTAVVAIGHVDSNGEFTGSAMAQHDPVADYALHSLPSTKDDDALDTSKATSTPSEVDPTSKAQLLAQPPSEVDANYPAPLGPNESKNFTLTGTYTSETNGRVEDIKIRPLFIHANFPKFDPATLFLTETQPRGQPNPTFDSNGTQIRPWGATLKGPNFDYVGYDVERAFWEVVRDVACDWKDAFGAWKGNKDKGLDVCFVVEKWTEKVFG